MSRNGKPNREPCVTLFGDEYANRIPNPKHNPRYTKVKVLHTQDKQHIS